MKIYINNPLIKKNTPDLRQNQFLGTRRQYSDATYMSGLLKSPATRLLVQADVTGRINWLKLCSLVRRIHRWPMNSALKWWLMWKAFPCHTWWRHQMETFSALLAICAGNSPVSGEFPAQRPVTRGFDVFFDLRLNKRLGKQSWGWWLETLSCSLWRQSNVSSPFYLYSGQPVSDWPQSYPNTKYYPSNFNCNNTGVYMICYQKYFFWSTTDRGQFQNTVLFITKSVKQWKRIRILGILTHRKTTWVITGLSNDLLPIRC